MQLKKYLSLIFGLAILALCLWILYGKLQHIELKTIIHHLQEIGLSHWLLACGAALGAYAALATYDALALKQLNKKISWFFITLCSFTTYALSHNIGASVFSGAAVRYRAYKTKGLDGTEVAFLVGFCSFTFALGVILLSGIILVLQPDIFQTFYPNAPRNSFKIIGVVFLFFILLYIIGSWLKFPPLKIGKKFKIVYPSLSIVIKQLIIAPLELIGSALIIYAVLPESIRPEFIVVLGIFLASFSATLLSNAPAGGIGVLEILFLMGLPNIPAPDLISALLVFRLLYLIIPLLISIIIIIIFEFRQWKKNKKRT